MNEFEEVIRDFTQSVIHFDFHLQKKLLNVMHIIDVIPDLRNQEEVFKAVNQARDEIYEVFGCLQVRRKEFQPLEFTKQS